MRQQETPNSFLNCEIGSLNIGSIVTRVFFKHKEHKVHKEYFFLHILGKDLMVENEWKMVY